MTAAPREYVILRYPRAVAAADAGRLAARETAGMTPIQPKSPLPLRRRAQRFAPGSYLTDGRRLLRVVDAGAGRAFSSLEDCLTLEVRLYSPGEMRGMGLRTVRGPV